MTLLAVKGKQVKKIESTEYKGKTWKVCPFCSDYFQCPVNMRCPGCGCKISIDVPVPSSAGMFCRACRRGIHRHHDKCKNLAREGKSCKCRVSRNNSIGIYADPLFVEDLVYRGLID